MDAQIQLLLEILDRGFDKTSWHGPNLANSFRGVDAKTAARNLRHRKSIWQQVLHATYWKHRVLNKLVGTTPFPRPDSNWPKMPVNITNRTWNQDKELLHKTHRKLRKAVAQLNSCKINPKLRMMTVGAAAHDVYHAGQIRLLRKLLKNQ